MNNKLKRFKIHKFINIFHPMISLSFVFLYKLNLNFEEGDQKLNDIWDDSAFLKV